MRNLLFTVSFALALFISSCAPSSEQAASYNDTIISEQILIIEKIDSLTESFNDYEIPDLMEKSLNAAKQQIDKSIANVNKLPKFDNTEDYKITTLELFNVYKAVVENEFSEMVKLYKIPDAEFKDEYHLQFEEFQNEAHNKMDKAEAKFSAYQSEFAKKYNLILQNE